MLAVCAHCHAPLARIPFTRILELKGWTRRIEQTELTFSARAALDQLSTMHLVENRLGDATIRTISRPSPQVQAILKAVGMPAPPTIVPADAGTLNALA